MRNNILEQIVVGSILGDGSIHKHSKCYSEQHCAKQKDYLLWKKKILDKLIFDKEKAKIRMTYYEKTNSYFLHISRHQIFEKYRKLCYPNGKKTVTNKFIKRIGKLAICVWYFDDGCYCPRTDVIHLSTYCFSYEENQKLQRMLKDRFNLNFKIYHRIRGDQYYLACSGKDTDKFLTFIKKNALYIPKSMTHKIGKFHKQNSRWIRKAIENRRNGERIRYQRDKEKISKRRHEYYSNNKEKMKKRSEEWRKNNPNLVKKQRMKYYLENREKVIEATKEYVRKNKKKILKYKREYRKNNLEKVREMARKYRKRKRRGFSKPRYSRGGNPHLIPIPYWCLMVLNKLSKQSNIHSIPFSSIKTIIILLYFDFFKSRHNSSTSHLWVSDSFIESKCPDYGVAENRHFATYRSRSVKQGRNYAYDHNFRFSVP